MVRRNCNSRVQSVDRSLEILRLLGRNGAMTSSALAAELGIHQSSASRQLRSLVDGGFVCKPDYHRFALDYGILLFAGAALSSFPGVAASAHVCEGIHRETGFAAAVAILQNRRLLYLAQVGSESGSALALVNDSDYPLARSSLGLALSYELGRDQMAEQLGLVVESVEFKRLYLRIERIYDRHGFLLLRRVPPNLWNAAGCFELAGRRAALAIYSKDRKCSVKVIRKLLADGTVEITEPISKL